MIISKAIDRIKIAWRWRVQEAREVGGVLGSLATAGGILAAYERCTLDEALKM